MTHHCEDNNTTAAAPPAIVLSSDDEDNGRMRPFHLSQKIVLEPPPLEHHQHVTGMEDERPNNIEAVAPPVIVISSDDEDNEGRRPLRHQKIVLEPVGRFLERNLTDCEENKDCKEELESMPGKFDLGINKDVDVGAANNMDCAKSIDQTEDMETFPEIFANWIDEEAYQTEDMEMPGIFAEDMEMPGIFDINTDLYQTEDMENLPGIFDFLIDEDVFQTEDVVAGISDVGTSENIGKGSPSASGNEESNNNHSNSENNKRDVECIAPSGEVKILTGDIDVGEGNQKFQIEEQNHSNDIVEDDLSDMWTEMTTALECSKDIAIDPSADEPSGECGEECEQSLILKDDLGWVCRICGVVQQGIENIFEFQYSKAKRTKRTYMCESRNANNEESTQSSPVGVKSTRGDLMATEICAHPRHRKQMKPHQVEGFNFLSSNLLTDKPGGCILAHAPGSGKTFLIISFVQSFLARFPHARPLVVLPKSVLATWKKEFRIWQVEDIPLYDFYTSKAENRSQQLDVLKQWVEQKSILFLGYTQFSTIICDHETSKTSVDCREILLEAPSILILDEGHTPRNESTNVLQSLARVKTPLKVVLSGTLYQNHVKEVFTILNLVRPKFLNLETSRAVMKCILSRVQILGGRKQLKAGTNSAFCDLVEQTLQKDEDFKKKVAVIQDLREMTRKVLHYYKGDILDELPGLVEFTVVLNLSSRQKVEVEKLKELSKFAKTSGGSLVYMHPDLKNLSDRYPSTREKGSMVNNEKLDEILENLDVREGVKIKFFLNMLGLCESSGEKLLVFSQYILPLKLMERIAVKEKGWSPDKEIFGITGDSTSKHREWSMERFNISANAKVFFGSIKACGEGISLVGASRVLIMDVQLNPSVTRQAIGRAFRPGQKRKVYVYRLVAADSPEEEDHLICFRKELISKMWFEWNESCGHQDFDMKTVDVNECEDTFLESRWLQEDIKLLQKR